MSSIKDQPRSDPGYSRRISESSRAGGIVGRALTDALFMAIVSTARVSSTRHGARTRLYTHAVACNHALQRVVTLPSCVRFLFPR